MATSIQHLASTPMKPRYAASNLDAQDAISVNRRIFEGRINAGGDAPDLRKTTNGAKGATTEVSLTNEARIALRGRDGLRKVEAGEDQSMAGWLKYGAALNEGRKLFPSDKQFHDWKVASQLATPSRDDAAAAMWAAANPNDFAAIKQANPKMRTVRGLHAKYKKSNPQKQQRKATSDDLRKLESLRALRDDRAASQGEKINAQAKLEGLEKDIIIEEPQDALPCKKDASRDIAERAAKIIVMTDVSRCPDVESAIALALTKTYGSTPEFLQRILKEVEQASR